MGRERLSDFSSTLSIPLLFPASLDKVFLRRGCHKVRAGVLTLLGWCQRREPEEQEGDAEIGDQSSVCFPRQSVLRLRIYEANREKPL